MKKIINMILSILKYLLLVLSFAFTLFIVLKMNERLSKGLGDSVFIFVPYAILLLLFVLNMVLDKDSVTKNTFFNITANLVFATNLVVGLRAKFDYNMLFNGIQKLGINFNYFNDYLAFNRIMLYGLIIANILFLFIPNERKVQKEVVETPVKKKTTRTRITKTKKK